MRTASVRAHRVVALLSAAVLGGVVFAAPAGARRVVVISGGGWGHGIGMSQYGAYGQALNGKTATQILEKYYKGANVASRRMPSKVRVGLAQSRSSIGIDSSPFRPEGGKVAFKVFGQKNQLAQGGSSATFRVERSDTGGLRLYKNGTRVRRNGKSVFGDPQHPLVLIYEGFGSLVSIEGKSYDVAYGRLFFGTYSSGGCGSSYCLRLVLSLPMQKYIYGLGEVPSSWPDASLRAQATAGRTYVFSKIQRLGQHLSPCDCAVYDTPIDQAYIGDSKRTGSGEFWDDWKGAVDATRGKVILHQGSPIQALYSSSSGGHTENNENVWGGTPIPYLRGVPDPADDVAANPNHTWKVKMSWRIFSDRLRGAFGMGKLERFRLIKPFGVSGRVTVVKTADKGGVKIVGTRKTVRADGWDIRSVLGLKDTLFRVRVRYAVTEAFARTYQRLHRAPGRATGSAYTVPRGSGKSLGRAQNFEIGRMTRSAKTGKVAWQWGPVLDKYDSLGREKSALEMPASGVWGPGEYMGANFEGGMILWSEETGARQMLSDFVTAFRRSGGVKGPLYLPTEKRKSSRKLPEAGRMQRFAGGTIYLNPHLGRAYALWGAIGERYETLGLARSACGYPTSNVRRADPGRRADFEHGTITYTRSAGVEVICG
jgi:SpoIID/LytB domain protein